MITPLAFADSLRIGSVDFVSPDEIKVLLDIEAPGDALILGKKAWLTVLTFLQTKRTQS